MTGPAEDGLGKSRDGGGAGQRKGGFALGIGVIRTGCDGALGGGGAASFEGRAARGEAGRGADNTNNVHRL